MASTGAYPRALYLIGVFKLVKGLALFAVGMGSLKLLDPLLAEGETATLEGRDLVWILSAAIVAVGTVWADLHGVP